MIHARRTLILLVALVVMAGPAVLIGLRAQLGAASFAADERVGRNELSAARVDIAVGSRTVPIVGANLAPGDIRQGSIEFTNVGTVGLRYSVRGDVVTRQRSVDLAQWLQWRVHWSPNDADCTATPGATIALDGVELVRGGAVTGDVAPGADPGDRVLEPGDTDVLCVEVEFDIDAPNSVQSTTLLQPFVAEAEQLVDTVGAGS